MVPFPVVGSCFVLHRPRHLCRRLGRMVGRHRRKERCGAGQSFDDQPRRRTRTSRPRGPNSRALSGIFASGSTPLERGTVCDKACGTGRLFNCKRCRRQVVLCRSCNRGQAYCSRACSARSRSERRREARGRYRRTERGRETGRNRQRRYRIRQADLARAAARAAAPETAAGAPSGDASAAPGDAGSEKTVTDHSSGPARPPLAAAMTARERRESPLRCAVCGRTVSHVVLADP